MNDTPDDLEFIARYAAEAARRAAEEGRHDDAKSMRARRVAAIRARAADVLREQIKEQRRCFSDYDRSRPIDPFEVARRARLMAEIGGLYRALDAVENSPIEPPPVGRLEYCALLVVSDAVQAARQDR